MSTLFKRSTSWFDVIGISGCTVVAIEHSVAVAFLLSLAGGLISVAADRKYN